MACPAPARLAAAASGEDAFATAHAADCTRCATTIAEQRELVFAASGEDAITAAHAADLTQHAIGGHA
jgi:hypothetical protein